jgi:HAD superfamily hydrolase (TIGR01484 family)
VKPTKQLIFSDFDGTLTMGENFHPSFFDIINLLQKEKLPLIIVSGRSLSWGHFLLTHFPINVVIMEGGGVIAYHDLNDFDHHDKHGHKGEIVEKVLISEEEIIKLKNITEEVLQKFEGKIRITPDSFGRKTDRAIDLKLFENNSDLYKEVTNFFDQHQVNYSCSSVHLNFWCGEISKFNAISYFLENITTGVDLDDCYYFGDAPNDESVFQFFKNSIGVSNIGPYLKDIKYPPVICLQGEENEGPLGVLNYLKELVKNSL